MAQVIEYSLQVHEYVWYSLFNETFSDTSNTLREPKENIHEISLQALFVSSRSAMHVILIMQPLHLPTFIHE